jgi:arylsulfatase A-like enzyme
VIKESTAEINGQTTTFKYRALSGDGAGDVDYWIAENGIKLLEKYKDKPFFIGIGFHRPHAIPTAPQRFYDLYDVNKIKLPPDFAEKPSVPAGFPAQSLPEKNDTFYVSGPVTPALASEIIRSYFASVSFVDWNMGRVLDALKRLGLEDNTIVIIGSDHGYHNGEKGRWGKTTFFDVAQQVPLIISVPGNAAKGQTCAAPVQLLDLYPTLTSLCGLPPPPGVEGHDLTALIKDPQAAWPYPALSMAKTAGAPIAYIARTSDWLYAEWKGGEAGTVLIDRQKDPAQTRNLADDPKLAPIIQQLKADLKKGFGNMPSAIRAEPGSDRPRPDAGVGAAENEAD